MKKFLAVALSVATLAMSTAAFAAGVNDDKDVASLDATDKATISSANGQMTVVVVPADFAGDAEDIYYINQDAATGMLGIVDSMGLKTELEDGEYEVRVGGTDATVFADGFKSFSFTISSAPTYVLGDATGDKVVNINDALEIVNHILSPYLTGDCLLAANANGDSAVNINDALDVVNYVLSLPSYIGGELK